ncbi:MULTISPECIES: polyprenyl synthetase family protein [unclassified Streptomyces]|uniref:polyprenyl synthetase family protein n=1 Tax=unclassified Streptomyces TaxID=2593676 RepID=UPI002ED5758D|nr:polyprenyl synthetase family protein [Streptomyces sp. NBC_00891]WSY09344.1 polyprenyl synthetase family protein [Streptomyces sp. NBC_00890]WSZ10966.1 polyprenyl synthetase family protein [Streptomyces sp. NBC_00869]WSZ21530.1 polyprenyl synthetase family protein [Streptomyces sp. NBC_00870]
MTSPTASPVTAPRILARCRALVRPALSRAVRRLHPWHGEITAFSLGWDGVDGGDVPGAQGKGVRQALAVLGAEAVGAQARDAVPGAVAVELIHTFSLLHDDIMDGDETRRRRATAWKAYGTGPAVLAGDALFAQAVRTLTDAPGRQGVPAVRLLAGTLTDLVHGQADDLLFESRPWTGPDAVRPHEYRLMAEHKTGALLGCAAGLGALLGGAGRTEADALAAAGRHLGVAFQAADDVLGIWGDPTVTGKPVHGDLGRGKKTYPVLAALAAGGPAATELAALLRGGPLDEGAVPRAAELVEEAGGRAAATAEAHRHLERARACLESVPLAPDALEEMLTLFPYVVDRVL